MTDDRSPAATATFGLFDGVTSALGVVVGLVAAGASPHTILVAAAGLAVAAAVGMAFGDYLAGASIRSATVMGVATLAGSLIPALPVALWPGRAGDYAAFVLVWVVSIVIGETRGGTLRDHLTTAATLTVASGLSITVSLLLGVTG